MRAKISPTAHLLVLAVMVLCHQTQVQAGTIDFEAFADRTPITGQIPGSTFTNATILTAGIGLDEFEFPPHSGTNVLFDDGGPISITFSIRIASFAAYFTHAHPLFIQGFDSTSTPVLSIASAFLSNMALSGDPGSLPNQFLALDYAENKAWNGYHSPPTARGALQIQTTLSEAHGLVGSIIDN